MKIKIFSIFDTKSCLFNHPFYLINDAVALRTATDLANDLTSQIGLNPEDYQLYCLGEYEDTEGKLDVHPPKFLYNFITLVKPETREITAQAEQADLEKAITASEIQERELSQEEINSLVKTTASEAVQ